MFVGVSFLQADVIAAYDTNVAVPGLSWLDHTYVCVDNSSNCRSFPSGSATTGGSVVTSGSATDSQVLNSLCYAAGSMTYLVQGVCHQHSNRMLYPINKELDSSVNGYSTSRWLYGTYGTNFWSIYCNY
ncbi:hypothetical protein KKH36_01535 [Patescibacteria group bacterium]|nr:hypothetical protein [Patescibacteria group bacterium]